MNCNEIMETMTAYMLDKILGKAAKQPPEAIMRHISACPSCREQMDIALKILTEQNFRLSKPPSCSEVNDRIPELVEMEEERIGDSFPAEWLHLQTCNECGALYRMTRSCMTPENEAAFDRVLQSALPYSNEKPAIWDKITPHLQKLTTELNILVSRGKEAMQQIPQWLGTVVLTPVPAQAYRGDNASPAYEQVITIPDSLEKRQIIVRTRTAAPGCIHLSIGLVDIDKDSCIGGVSMTILDAEGRISMQLSTPDAADSEGLAGFPDVAPGTYKLKITESQTSWELPLRLS